MIRHRSLLVPSIAATAAALALACASTAPVPAPSPVPSPAPSPVPAPTPVTDPDREMAALAFIAYAGERITGPDAEVSRELAPCFVAELAKQPLASGWELAWGPVVFRFDFALFNDNLMYVVRERDQPSRLAVVIRGTNAPAALDWLVEDFSVFDLHRWRYGDPPSGLRPKISHGTRKGLEILQGMVPPEGVPGAGQDLATFLGSVVGDQAGAPYTISVAGHSLGGALAPTLALWLSDTAGSWDPERRARLYVFAYAGPTPGDAGFAAYYDTVLGGSTRRIHNPLDVVPHVWVVEEMREIPDLYEPLTRLDHDERVALDLLIKAVRRKDFEHVVASAPPLDYRHLEPTATEFQAQVGWQHHCGYVCGLGIRDTLLPVSSDCKSSAPDPCPVCP